MMIFSRLWMARQMRFAALCRLGIRLGSCRHLRLGERNAKHSSGWVIPRLSSTWAMTGEVLSRSARAVAAASLGGAMIQRLGLSILARNLIRERLPWQVRAY